jgi:hypothetical protein
LNAPIHLRRRKRDRERFALDELTTATSGFSGAEIEQAIVSAMYAALAEDAELTDAQLHAELRTVP